MAMVELDDYPLSLDLQETLVVEALQALVVLVRLHMGVGVGGW